MSNASALNDWRKGSQSSVSHPLQPRLMLSSRSGRAPPDRKVVVWQVTVAIGSRHHHHYSTVLPVILRPQYRKLFLFVLVLVLADGSGCAAGKHGDGHCQGRVGRGSYHQQSLGRHGCHRHGGVSCKLEGRGGLAMPHQKQYRTKRDGVCRTREWCVRMCVEEHIHLHHIGIRDEDCLDEMGRERGIEECEIESIMRIALLVH